MTDRPVDLANVRTWPARVRTDVRRVLTRGLTVNTSPALLTAIHEITSVIDQADAEARDA